MWNFFFQFLRFKIYIFGRFQTSVTIRSETNPEGTVLGTKSVTTESISEIPRKIFLAIKISYNFYWKRYTTSSWYILSTTRSKHCWGKKRLSRNKRPKIAFMYEIFFDTLSTKLPEQNTQEKWITEPNTQFNSFVRTFWGAELHRRVRCLAMDEYFPMVWLIQYFDTR